MQKNNKSKNSTFSIFTFITNAKATTKQKISSVVVQHSCFWNHSPIALLAVFRAAFPRSFVTHSLNLNQVIKARFGARTHLVFCTFAFFTNLIVMMSLTVAGTAVLNR